MVEESFFGKRTDKKFLTLLIPQKWEEIVFDNDSEWCVAVKRTDFINHVNMAEKEVEFEELKEVLKNEFGSNLIKIASSSSTGRYFIVHLKKDQ